MISIIIVNYNSSELVINSITSIIKLLPTNSFEIIVVDNGSAKEDQRNIEDSFPEVNLIKNYTNDGFGKANNKGVIESKGEFFLFLNPDTIIIEDFVSPILDFLVNNKQAGVCGPRLIYKDGRNQNSTGIKLGYLYETAEALMFINVLRYFYNKIIRSKAGKSVPVEVSWLSAACIIIKRELFIDVGGFNPEFFLNYEDIDLCERVRRAGYKNYLFPQLSCIHLDQQSQSKNFDSFVYNRYAGRAVYGKNNYGPLKRNVIRIIHIAGIALRIGLTGILYQGKEKKERLSGYKRAFKLYTK
jgi:hypothetical protein